MTKSPILQGKDVIKALQKIGYTKDQRIFRWENFVILVFKELYNKFGINPRAKDMRFM